jgi:hypothetical protein
VTEKDKASKTGLSGLARLSSEKKRAALETSAALAGVSLKVSRAFVEAVPDAGDVLSADDLRLWGELGRRVAMGSAAAGIKFFSAGVTGFAEVPESSRSAVFQICTRQLVLSSSIALATFEQIPEIASKIEDKKLLGEMFELAAEIAQRSAKHSADFLEHTAAVADAIARYEGDADKVAASVLSLAHDFASRTGFRRHKRT